MELYGEGARALQDQFDARRLADALAARIVHDKFTDDDIALIEAQPTVWISTVDADGWPDVSYKGGDVGFVQVASRTELRIPMYDGNGMMRTMGNIIDTGRVALLFVDTDRPWRMRVHGTARISTDADDVEPHVGAFAVAIFTLGRAFPNCGRYIHRADSISEYAPRPGHEPPVPEWKQRPEIQPLLPGAGQLGLVPTKEAPELNR